MMLCLGLPGYRRIAGVEVRSGLVPVVCGKHAALARPAADLLHRKGNLRALHASPDKVVKTSLRETFATHQLAPHGSARAADFHVDDTIPHHAYEAMAVPADHVSDAVFLRDLVQRQVCLCFERFDPVRT